MSRTHRFAALAAALALATALPAALAAGPASLDLEQLEHPHELVPIAGAKTPLLVQTRVVGAPVSPLPDVDARLVSAQGAVVAQAPLAPSEGDLWSAELDVPHTTPPGSYELVVEADTLDESATITGQVEVLSLAAVALEEPLVDFGSGAPNSVLGPAGVTVVNQGNVPVRIALKAAPLLHEGEGDPLAPERVEVHGGEERLGSLAAALSVGTLEAQESRTLDLYLHLPSGAVQYVPPGAYHGSITVEVQGVVA